MAMLYNQMVIRGVISNLGDPQYCSRTLLHITSPCWHLGKPDLSQELTRSKNWILKEQILVIRVRLGFWNGSTMDF